uniref:Uncharacterized protein n=1 Tax=Anguilla anguilla TaxID=7936 RepID=A0A0E9Q4Z2_ANGAN
MGIHFIFWNTYIPQKLSTLMMCHETAR